MFLVQHVGQVAVNVDVSCNLVYILPEHVFQWSRHLENSSLKDP